MEERRGEKKIEEKKKETRPPGRPRLHPRPKKNEREGIVNEPAQSGNIIEFEYDDPLQFKKALAPLKNLETREPVFLSVQYCRQESRAL